MYRFSIYIICILSVSGCYESPSDLIGEHASKIQKFDSLIVRKNDAYVVTPKGNQAVLCGLTTRSDLKKPCVEGIDMKMERTNRGNYIVQIQEFKGAKFKYALWPRSEPAGSIAAFKPCTLWIGDGIVENGPLTGHFSEIGLKYGNDPGFQEFAGKVRSVATEPLINRQQLLQIVKIYEDTLANAVDKSWNCIDDRISATSSLIAIEGDNRHLIPFEAPKTTH